MTDAAHGIGMRFLRFLLVVNPNPVISMILLLFSPQIFTEFRFE